MWIALGKCQAVSEFVRINSEFVRICSAPKTPQTRMDKGFAACPRAGARKNKKKLLKNRGNLPLVCG
jgi:hypothetical protein